MLKQIEYVTGRLMIPLQVGSRAIIRSGGDFIYTSLVVDILKYTADYACFETMHAIYKVSLGSVPAESPVALNLKVVA